MGAINMFEILGFKLMLINRFDGYYVRYTRSFENEKGESVTQEILFQVKNEKEPLLYLNTWESSLGKIDHVETFIDKDIFKAINEQYTEIINGYTKRKMMEDEMEVIKSQTNGLKN
jgi:hypothetical protein